MGMFDDLREEREAREAKAHLLLDDEAHAAATANARREGSAARAEAAFADLDKMVHRVLTALRDAAYPECEVRPDVPRLRWLLGINAPGRPHDQPLFEPVIVVAPVFDVDGATARLQCESTFADAFRERRARGRVERTADLTSDALAVALRKLHRH